MLACGVKTREATGASIAVAIEKAGNNRDIARLNIAMEREVITGSNIVRVGAAFAGWAYVGIADFGEEIHRLRVSIERRLLFSTARAEETACRVSASYLLVIGRGNNTDDSVGEAMAGFCQEVRTHIGTRKGIKYSAPSISHQRGISHIAGQRP